MNQFLSGVVRATVESFDLPAPLLEIGSYQVAGQEALIDLRGLFPGKDYIGLDMRDGPGVDWVGNVEELPMEDGSVGTVIAMNTFEHVRHFWRGFEEIHRVLRPDGLLLFSVPFHFQIHGHPSDYWRFTPEAIRVLLEPFACKLIGWQGPRSRPLHVWALAGKGPNAAFTAERASAYRRRLTAYAHEPLPRLKTWRYRLARWLSGRGFFAPYLEQNRWELTAQGLMDQGHGCQAPQLARYSLSAGSSSTLPARNSLA